MKKSKPKYCDHDYCVRTTHEISCCACGRKKPLATDNHFSTFGKAGESKPLAKRCNNCGYECTDSTGVCGNWIPKPLAKEKKCPDCNNEGKVWSKHDDDYIIPCPKCGLNPDPTPRTMEDAVRGSLVLSIGKQDRVYIVTDALKLWIRSKIEGMEPIVIDGIELLDKDDVLKALTEGGE